jgi:hypothetical protein
MAPIRFSFFVFFVFFVLFFLFVSLSVCSPLAQPEPQSLWGVGGLGHERPFVDVYKATPALLGFYKIQARPGGDPSRIVFMSLSDPDSDATPAQVIAV